MSKRKTRNRHLGKLAARRMAAKRRKQRQRAIAMAVAAAVAVAGVGLAALAFLGGKSKPQAQGTPTPSATASVKPGKQTGTVNLQGAPRKVACGANAPADASTPKPQFAGPPPMKIDTKKTYTATMVTSCGTITIELLAKQAPQTVNSFVFLADHHFFDGQIFHRLDTSIDVLQGGDPTGTGTGGPGYSIPDELTGTEKYVPGTLAMANSGQPNSGGSRFFVITGDKGASLPANYTIFGTVVKGLDVAQRIQGLPIRDPSAGLSGQQPKMAIYIDKVTITVGK